MKIDEKKVIEISSIKNEPKWMLDFRLKSLKKFNELSNPNFGPELKIDFDEINYYKRVTDTITNDWNNLDKDIYNTFEKIRIWRTLWRN